ncbi:RsmB/NOP family class I SAM-dependent RNA methyltransferase [Botrimarina hoheduenensis]|uniref:RsmB/NOP family class I SAM-dependent RNA methyltransferase n=1 Tax=Botrimarina hoheduenensis TaxID=2528000 RepID=UPI0018D3E683|nr:RsmB/NOP family class I SAM-dependent RNA methyltransferase [Botrimarina hoheduenensis]
MTDDSPGLPTEFVERLRAIFGNEADAVLATFGSDRRPGVWANPLRTQQPIGTLLAGLGVVSEACPWLTTAATIAPEAKPLVTNSAEVAAGALYVQNLSSMLAPWVLAPQPGESVLDLAAAPGGKTLHLAARMLCEGELAAVEPVRPRRFKLSANLERCGADGFVRVYPHDGREVGRKTPARFDAVLLDAPCSSEARFDPRNPATFAYWGPRKLAESARKQKSLLRSALDATKPGGRVLYCTCSFAPEENELVVAHTLRRMGAAIELTPLELPVATARPGLHNWRGKSLPSDLTRTLRVLPDRQLAGFYLALFAKR